MSAECVDPRVRLGITQWLPGARGRAVMTLALSTGISRDVLRDQATGSLEEG
jgi:hypothetical protein